jgi:hypothetical protein
MDRPGGPREIDKSTYTDYKSLESINIPIKTDDDLGW